MTTDIIELSKQAAEVLGIPPSIYVRDKARNWVAWLAEDSGRCAEIATDRGMKIDMLSWTDHATVAYLSKNRVYDYVLAHYADHQGDRNAAWRVAVLKAVIEQGKQS